MSVQGQFKTFHDSGDSGQAVDPNFCPECGSPIFTDAADLPEFLATFRYGRPMLLAGAIDMQFGLEPACVVEHTSLDEGDARQHGIVIGSIAVGAHTLEDRLRQRPTSGGRVLPTAQISTRSTVSIVAWPRPPTKFR
jgi:hypothetical protein